MGTITEDYVSFETAKLLKEKGFDEDCWCWYEEDGYFRESNDDFGFQSNSWHVVDDDEFTCSAPTLQMIMKWLREVHNIHITIYYSAFLYGTRPYYWNIDKMDTLSRANTQIETSTNTHDYSFVHYETACEAAIKYCLENLI